MHHTKMDELIYSYQLLPLVDFINRSSFQRIIIQFIDEYIDDSIDIFCYIESKISENISLYITGDSAFGSSLDDISAMHVDGDLLVYFGTDLSCSSSTSIIIITKQTRYTGNIISSALSYNLQNLSDIPNWSEYLILYDPCYQNALLSALEISSCYEGQSVTVADLPLPAKIKLWDSSLLKEYYSLRLANPSSICHIGGLEVEESVMRKVENNQCGIIYIGDKHEKITNISIKLSQQSLICFNPKSNSFEVMYGESSRGFLERFGGIARIDDASVIGILIGSMGLSTDITRKVSSRLCKLIEAANKRYVLLVMGKLNESKLCNFPEIDLFCLITNDDVALIKPKTFPVPVVTPFELEIGLGARDWECYYETDVVHLIDNENLALAVQRVKSKFGFSEINEEDGNDRTTNTNIIDEQSQQLSVKNIDSQLMNVTENIFTSRFLTRDYTGLLPEVNDSSDIDIKVGLFGTATAYTQQR